MEKTAEIELKAHVGDPNRCKEKLCTLAGVETVFSKDDVYWFVPAHEGSDKTSRLRLPSGLRVRRESTALPDGAARQSCTKITWKNKEKRADGLEVNEEHEFEVSAGTVFEELLTLLGLEKQISKHKQGWSWRYRGITAELCEVTGALDESKEQPKNLGWFLELEILAEEENGKIVAEAKERLFALLEETGIGKENIESRYYRELLAD